MGKVRAGGLAAAAGLLGGLAIAFYPAALSGLRRIPGGLMDSRLVHFTLEHAHRAVTAGESLWNPPIYFPERNVAAFTDLAVSFLPLYSPWRLLGLPADLALLAWLAGVAALNFLAFYGLLRRLAAVSGPAAALGAFLFAFGSPRLANLHHPQLAPDFFVIGALYAFARAFQRPCPAGAARPAAERPGPWFGAGLLALTLQAWGAIYPFAFAGAAAALAGLGALGTRAGRAAWARLLRRGGRWALAGVVLAALALAPLSAHYRTAYRQAGPRSWADIYYWLPRPASWLWMGPDNLAYGWLQRPPFVTRERRYLASGTHSNGLGVATTMLATLGLWRRRRSPAVGWLLLPVPFLIAGTTLWPGDMTAWRWLFETVPGADGLRAVARAGRLLLIPGSLGLAFFFDTRRGGSRRATAMSALLAAACLAEQLHRVPSFDRLAARERVARLAGALAPDCRCFFASAVGRRRDFAVTEDAMWAALATGVPTVNGRYGNRPAGWPDQLWHASRAAGRDAAVPLYEALSQWAASRRLDPSRLCWVEVLVEGGTAGGMRRLSETTPSREVLERSRRRARPLRRHPLRQPPPP